MWPFGRRKKGRADAAMPSAPPSHLAPHRTASRRSRRPRRRSTHSNASMRDVEKAAVAAQSSTDDLTALPQQRRLEHSPHLRPVTQEHGFAYNFYSPSHASLPQPSHDRATLVRRKSSKRRRENDHVREEEIRAMTFPMPQKRPAGNSGGILRRDSKKVKGTLNHRFERPTSTISLPLQDSVHSSMSGNSDPRAFRVSAFDMFSPRPTIRLSGTSQFNSPHRTSPVAYPSRTGSRREPRPTSGGAERRHRKRVSRIDDLADELDAGALREIMERDKRRQERKERADQERLRRRLERRAEQQDATEVAAGTPPTPRKEATGAVGLGIGRGPPTPMEDVRPSTPQPEHHGSLPLTPRTPRHDQLPTPLDSPMEEPVVSDARAIRYSRGSVSARTHTRGPSNVSELPELLSEKQAQEAPIDSVEVLPGPSSSGPLHPVDTTETVTSKPPSARRRSSDGRRMGMFSSLFRRRGTSQDQGPTSPSEGSFSNTSRESMSRQSLPAHLVGVAPATAPIQIRRPSGVPHRSGSKFKEHLPEYPISPPASRMQSPEASVPSAIAARRRSQPPADLRVQTVSSQAAARSDSPVSPGVPPTHITSQSFASVDSEGSWLKRQNRGSTRSQIRSSRASSGVQRNPDFSASDEELAVIDDEYLRGLTPQFDDRRASSHSNDLLNRKPSSTVMALDPAPEFAADEGNSTTSQPTPPEEDLIKNGVARSPTIIHRQQRVKSTEVLLGCLSDDKATEKPQESPTKSQEAGPETPDSPASDAEPVMVQRARSVDFGRHHVRHLSAGSAKLLDIQKRSSASLPKKKTGME